MGHSLGCLVPDFLRLGDSNDTAVPLIHVRSPATEEKIAENLAVPRAKLRGSAGTSQQAFRTFLHSRLAPVLTEDEYATPLDAGSVFATLK